MNISLEKTAWHRCLLKMRLVIELEAPGSMTKLRGDLSHLWNGVAPRQRLCREHLNLHVVGIGVPACHYQDWEFPVSGASLRSPWQRGWRSMDPPQLAESGSPWRRIGSQCWARPPASVPRALVNLRSSFSLREGATRRALPRVKRHQSKLD